eukprot:CAMPEP_0197067088 /NCGR_PEP_ID=MMETSP1384-20130603/177930_1 /TAXON_ID=29189 /ORGANISM="Ammonia sp." /LENGTH=62 /DNA_ID=CAMNT_0042504437 /DNA_START=12 /DNA_END=197 /DNA_ORIENTATION=+
MHISHSKQLFLGNLQLDIWDCGGQPWFMKTYFHSQRETVFSNVAVLIYVLDIQTLQNPQQHK